MKRIDTATRAVDLFGPGKDGWRNSNKGAGIAATQIDADFMNHLQEEIAKVIEGEGIALDSGDRTQLDQAIDQKINNALTDEVALQGAFRNLKGSAPGTSAVVTYTADEIVTGDGAGNYQSTSNWNTTITMTTLGPGGIDAGAVAASTWYYSYAITKPDGTKALIASLSSTGPSFANAPGYDKWSRIGSFRTDASANKYPLSFQQAGRRCQYKVAAGSNVPALPTMASGVQGNISTPTWVAVAVANFVPPTATLICLVLANTVNSNVICAPNNSYGGYNSATNIPPLLAIPATSNVPVVSSGDLVLESSNIYYASNQAAAILQCKGWEDNL